MNPPNPVGTCLAMMSRSVPLIAEVLTTVEFLQHLECVGVVRGDHPATLERDGNTRRLAGPQRHPDAVAEGLGTLELGCE